ncbi:iron uptake system component EfeO [Pseudoclavibacter sp. JAI123]|uniref:iron uptake system protein EfeO n=1 Tax=Pseudoclavibacter sp. JAI123 TaxID=2723065 RepID=UPI0015C71CBD|nr:iron uptake system protein EfeO [Pseudoclavibacter sp. JAI123]NYF12601.1 iron uptake system component EfeO [Pseudoclavibacter sp. JAI123]
MHLKPLAAGLLSAAALVSLTGCVPNAPADSASSLAVSSTDSDCTVSGAAAASGPITFDVTNEGERVTEFYLLADDGLRIVGEVENIAPGTSRQLSVVAQPGSYFTVCKPGMIGEGIGQTEFEVSGEAVEVAADDQAAYDEAVTSYTAYLRNQVSELVPLVEQFTTAYKSGDDAKARELFAAARVPYERIEPTAEAFGDLDPKIDYREVDAVAEGLDWTGFHRIEKDLWQPQPGDKNSDDTDAFLDWAPSTPEERTAYADQLVADIQELADLVNGEEFVISIEDITNGAIGLLDEVATGKISGEEDWWSGTDLSDFKANVEGAEVAFGIVEDVARSKGEDGTAIADSISTEFTALNDLLGSYGSYEEGFTNYRDLTPDQVKELSTQVDALAEPLSQLTTTVLGLQA